MADSSSLDGIFKQLTVYRLMSPFPLIVFLLLFGVWNLLFQCIRVPLVFWKWISIVTAGFLFVLAAAYLVTPVLVDFMETSVVAIANVGARGLPLYPPADAAPRYGLVYGPLLYMVLFPFYSFLGQTLFAARLPGFLAFLFVMYSLYRISRYYASRTASLIGLGFFALVLGRFGVFGFYAKGDPLLLACMTASVWAILRGRPAVLVAVTAISIAAMPNIKITGVFYALPILGLIGASKGWRLAALNGVIAAVLSPLPFVLPNVSVANFLAIMETYRRWPLAPAVFLRFFQYSILFLMPALVAVLGRRRLGEPLSPALRVYLITTVAGMAGTSIACSKTAAGANHLLPYLIPIIHIYFWIRSEARESVHDGILAKVAVPLVLTLAASALVVQGTVARAFRALPVTYRAIAEIRAVESASHGSTVAVGFGDAFEDWRDFLTFQPVLDGHPYMLDGGAIVDMDGAGQVFPDATIRYFERCGTAIWLIPKGQKPFSGIDNLYFDASANHPTFDARFRNTFFERYRYQSSGTAYDVWSCIVPP